MPVLRTDSTASLGMTASASPGENEVAVIVAMPRVQPEAGRTRRASNMMPFCRSQVRNVSVIMPTVTTSLLPPLSVFDRLERATRACALRENGSSSCAMALSDVPAFSFCEAAYRTCTCALPTCWLDTLPVLSSPRETETTTRRENERLPTQHTRADQPLHSRPAAASRDG